MNVICFIFNNIGSIITVIILLVIVLFVIKILFNRKKRGGCSCGCDSCDRSGSCSYNDK